MCQDEEVTILHQNVNMVGKFEEVAVVTMVVNLVLVVATVGALKVPFWYRRHQLQCLSK